MSITKYDFIKSHCSEDGDWRLIAIRVWTTLPIIVFMRLVSELKWKSGSGPTLGPG